MPMTAEQEAEKELTFEALRQVQDDLRTVARGLVALQDSLGRFRSLMYAGEFARERAGRPTEAPGPRHAARAEKRAPQEWTGERIKDARRAAGWTVQTLAQTAGVSTSRVYELQVYGVCSNGRGGRVGQRVIDALVAMEEAGRPL
jgi:hypothetical protein